MTLAPVALFTYNRPKHTLRTIEALKNSNLSSDTDLIIFSDAAKNDHQRTSVEETRKLIKNITGFKNVKIIERPSNYGLAKSIITGITEVLENHEHVIVLEDDIEVSKNFLEYMNQGLSFYKEKKQVLSITGWSPESLDFPKNYDENIFFHPRPMSWSWATWKDRWSKVDWSVTEYEKIKNNPSLIKSFNTAGTDLFEMLQLQMSNKIDSWYVRWCYHSFINKQVTVYPRHSFVQNNGHDGTGVHCTANEKYSHSKLIQNQKIIFKEVSLNSQIIKSFNKFFNLGFKSKIKNFIKGILPK